LTSEGEIAEGKIDLDGDGKTSVWETNLCRLCITAAILLAFGDKAVAFI
jgi:hypothetical protein